MAIPNGTMGVMGLVNTRMSDAQSFLQKGAPPAGREDLYKNLLPKTDKSEASNNSQSLGQLLGNSYFGQDQATSSVSDLSSMLLQLVQLLMPQKKKSTAASQFNKQFAQVKPLEQPVKVAKGDLSPLGSSGGDE